MQLPKEKKYQNCLLRLMTRKDANLFRLPETEHMPEKQIILQLVVMGDPVWLCLFKADFTDKQVIRGDLRVKLKIRNIEDLSIEEKEPKRLNLTVKMEENEISHISLYFDTP